MENVIKNVEMSNFKYEYGLTNSEIAEGIDSLSDDDFYEVFKELAKDCCNSDESIGSWLDKVLQEIKQNIESEV